MSDADQLLMSRLRRAQWFATGLLAIMAMIFIASAIYAKQVSWLGYVVAFSEAALIGGLADWFAVTALFRRPLGLPIPHTAIVPTRKDEIGRALAQFVGNHFLVGDAVEKRLARSELAGRLGVWLKDQNNADRLSHDIGVAADWLLSSARSSELRGGVKAVVEDIVKRTPVNEAIAAVIDVLASGNNAQLLIDQLTQFGRQQLEENKLTIRSRIEDRSPWWMPKFVDEEIYDQLVSEFERLLSEIGDNIDHPARQEFNNRLASMREKLLENEVFAKRGETLRDEFISHPAVRDFLQSLWVRATDYLQVALDDSDSKLRKSISAEIQHVGVLIENDQSVRQQLDSWFREAIVYIVENYRGSLSEIISDTVAEWDPQSTSEKIELHIGKDLQFIRINGTIVGGLVGLALYVVLQALNS